MELLYFLFIVTLVHLIHELGHAYFGANFKAKINEISLGMGPIIVATKTVSIRLLFFLGGYCFWEERHVLSNLKLSVIHLGGVIFNFITATIILLFIRLVPDHLYDMIILFILYSYFLVIINVIPYRFIKKKSDGWLVLEALYFAIRNRKKQCK
ncbi:site-2 protease family protein [Cytobacillus sp. IB215316]|uniref:site-2 protease family protein n=1 Tax=Cytobacillus sp. IB215316 TaxID=3097354 RepID=UPI002A13676E|nr:site-2 protease family protein [Cytobacillus sp. IB215316]MDX8361969.1 site-2 protease family protein [Cytobacillus sp. IB215316]